MALVKLGRFDEALQSCERALAIKSDYADALYNRGNALRALGRHDDACASYSAALALEPRRADALNNLGLALLAFGQYGEALANFDAALAIEPDDIGALHNRANALAELGSFEAALDAVRPGLGRKSGSCRRAQYPRCRAREARRSRALASYDAALAAAPIVSTSKSIAVPLLELDRFDEALASFDKASRAIPTILPR